MNVAIIAAAGVGRRMAGKRPKQFLELAGVPIIFHALRAFEDCDLIHQIVVVLAADETDGFPRRLKSTALTNSLRWCRVVKREPLRCLKV